MISQKTNTTALKFTNIPRNIHHSRIKNLEKTRDLITEYNLKLKRYISLTTQARPVPMKQNPTNPSIKESYEQFILTQHT